MQTSQLIKQLQESLKKHGDVTVKVYIGSDPYDGDQFWKAVQAVKRCDEDECIYIVGDR